MNRGQWYDFVVHYKYSYNGDGLIEVYGAPAGNQLQPLKTNWTKLFNDASGQFRIGLYGAETTSLPTLTTMLFVSVPVLNEVKPR